VKPVGLHAVYHAWAATGLPIIGMGGVANAQDCIEFLAAGAAVVGIGTSLFVDPELPRRLLPELGALLRRHGAHRIGELVGVAHPQVSSSTRA
jgi:dihydroorotate dehydrogenase (NAD+) catalytic subunit